RDGGFGRARRGDPVCATRARPHVTVENLRNLHSADQLWVGWRRARVRSKPWTTAQRGRAAFGLVLHVQLDPGHRESASGWNGQMGLLEPPARADRCAAQREAAHGQCKLTVNGKGWWRQRR